MASRNVFSLLHFCPLQSSIFTFLFLLITPSFLVAQVTPADFSSHSKVILSLANGDQISGLFITVNETQIELENQYAGKLTIPFAEIKGWQASEPSLRQHLTPFIKLKDKDTLAAESLAEKEKSRVVSAKSPSLSKGDGKQGKTDAWKRQVNFAYTMTRGNVKSSDVNMAFSVSRKRGTRKVGFTSYARSGVSQGKESAKLLSSTFRYDQTVFKLPIFTESQFEIDKLKKLDYRISENIGVSYPMLKGDTQQLSFDFGTGVTKEDYETGLQKLNATSLLRLKASQKLSSKTVLNQEATFFSDLADPSSYRIQAEASLTTPITKNLALRLTGINRYDARPITQTKPNDFTLLTGFTFDF